MIKRNKAITEESLEMVALIKFQFVQTMVINNNAERLSKKKLQKELDNSQITTAKMLAVFQAMNSDLSYSESIKLLCEWINNNDLLVKSVEKLFAERTFFKFSDEITSKDIKEVHDNIINSMGITIKKELLNVLVEEAEKDEREDQ